MAIKFSDQRPWADLPSEMLSSIANRIESRHDLLHFRAVCSSWRKTAPLPKKSPFWPLVLRSILDPATNQAASYPLAQTIVFKLEIDARDGPVKRSCLLKLQEDSEDGKLRFLSPFSMYPLKNRPKSLPEFLDIRDFRVSEVTKGVSPPIACFIANPYYYEMVRLYKAAISSNFDENPKIMLVKRGELWHIDSVKGFRYLIDPEIDIRDIVNFNNKFYILDTYRVVTGYDQNSMNLVEFYPRPTPKLWEGERYFVKSKGDIFTVYQEFSPEMVYYDEEGEVFVREEGVTEIPIRFRVFKGDQREFGFDYYNWEEVKDLGERVFFLSHDCSFSFSAHDLPGCRGNCIIYVDQVEEPVELTEEDDDDDDDADDEDDDDDDDDAAAAADEDDDEEDGEELVELKNGKVGIFFMEDRRYVPIAYFPEYLSIFWPPPSWLRSEAVGSSGQ